jgi:putative transcriptional regulator
MRKAKKKPTGPQPKVDIGAEVLSSVREMKTGIRARVHRPEVSEVAHARLVSGLSQAAF